MGTNYYLKSKPCETCGNCQQNKHIGKCSSGWQFLFRSYYGGPSSYKEWLEEITNEKKEIYDEYNEKINKNDFLKLVDSKKQGKTCGEDMREYFCDLGYRFTPVEFS